MINLPWASEGLEGKVFRGGLLTAAVSEFIAKPVLHTLVDLTVNEHTAPAVGAVVEAVGDTVSSAGVVASIVGVLVHFGRRNPSPGPE